MITLRAAASLLAQTDSLPALRDMARIMGFRDAQTLTRDVRRELAIDDLVQTADVSRGPGRMRCLSAVLSPTETRAGVSTHVSATDSREHVRRLSIAITNAAPARAWCLILLDASKRVIVVAAVTVHPSGARIAALRVDRERVVDSDADTLRALAATTETLGALRHARFAEILGRDALSSRFYRALNSTVATLADTAHGVASPTERRELALLCASRCLFLAFLEAKGWLNHNREFLMSRTTAQLEHGGRIHERFLRPLFFGTLNTPVIKRAATARSFGDIPFLNGGLFSPTPLERKHRSLRFADDALAVLLCDLLDRYRFTAHEDSTRWSEAAIDPEMLGRSFESLMAQDERHQSGSYYTPPSLVETVVQDALATILPEVPPDALSADSGPLHVSPATRTALSNIRILDPACGSGAFLVYMLERLAVIESRIGDPRPIHTIRRELLTRRIFGVDRNPMAVWLCELRLWLSIVIECPETRITNIAPLPNLDHHIRLGDTLAGGTFQFAPPSSKRLTVLRERYTRATGARKHTLNSALDREERQRALLQCQRMRDNVQRERADVIDALRTRDLFGERPRRTQTHAARLRALKDRKRELDTHHRRLQLGGALPFRFGAHFADVASNGGFDLVIGNPPWVRPHALALSDRVRLRSEYRSMRHAAWRTGARRAGAGTGFAAQADIAAAFVERSVQLLAPHGVAALLVPAKLWRALAGGGIREWLAEHTHIRTIRDWSQAPALFGAAVYPSLIVAQRHHTRHDHTRHDHTRHDHTRHDHTLHSHTLHGHTPQDNTPHNLSPANNDAHKQHTSDNAPVHVNISHANGSALFTVPRRTLHFDADPAAPWILLPPALRDAFERLRAAGPALGDSSLGRPMLGVKCGFNAAFLVQAQEHDDDSATISANGRHATIERRMLRPALRGDAVQALTSTERDQPNSSDALRILWTHDVAGEPLRTLPPNVARWLAHYRPQLERRRDARTRLPWWSLFRTEAARHEAPRVVWADIGKRLSPRVLTPGDPTVPLNTCYVMRTASMEDARALATLLGSPIAHAWFDVLAEPARGGFRRFMGWTVATLPIPKDWVRARTTLAELSRPELDKWSSRSRELHAQDVAAVVADAYGIPLQYLEPLLRWTQP